MSQINKKAPGGETQGPENEQQLPVLNFTNNTPDVKPCLALTRAAAQEYLSKKWVYVLFQGQTKAPKTSGWQKRTLASINVDEVFQSGLTNIGLILGSPSGGLTDIDLDCPEAVQLAPHFLPKTDAIFGRKSKPASHYLYISDVAKTTQFKIPKCETSPGGMLVEVRATGGQTMAPPSIHPSGEQVTWSKNGDPAKVDSKTLTSAARRLAFASILLRNWDDGLRNELGLCAAGSMLSAGWEDTDAEHLLGTIATITASTNKNWVSSTRQKFIAGEAIKGTPTLAQLLGVPLQTLQNLLGRGYNDTRQASDTKYDFEGKDSNAIARCFAKDHFNIRHWRSSFYLWNDHFWSIASEEDLSALVGTWLESKTFLNEHGFVMQFKPKSHDVNEVLKALARLFHFEDAKSAPFWTDPTPDDADPVNLLPFRNGLLNLKTLELLPSDPRLFALHKADCDFNPDAVAPSWDQFMSDIFPENDGCQSCIEEIFGYFLTSDTSYQKAFLFQGVRRSGKGTLGRVFRAAVGEDRWAGPTMSSFANDFGLQQVLGKSVAMIADSRGGSRYDPHVLVERILSITGEDSLTVNRKHKEHWNGILPTRLIIASNTSPKLSDPSGVVVSRFIAVPFQQSFEGREDPGLTNRLLSELPGIINRALSGLMRLRERGRFLQPEVGRDLLQLMDENTSPVRNFIEDCCVFGPDFEVDTQILYETYKSWALQHGHQRMASSTFGTDLNALGKGIKSQQRRIGGHRERVYTGIKLASTSVALIPWREGESGVNPEWAEDD